MRLLTTAGNDDDLNYIPGFVKPRVIAEIGSCEDNFKGKVEQKLFTEMSAPKYSEPESTDPKYEFEQPEGDKKDS